jgi:hypothetical protein
LAALLGLALAFRSTERAGRWRRASLWTACAVGVFLYFSLIEHRMLREAAHVPAGGLTITHWNQTLDNLADVPALLRKVEAFESDIVILTGAPSNLRLLLDQTGRASVGFWTMSLHTRLPIASARLLVLTSGMLVAAIEIDANEALGRSIVVYMVDLPSSPRTWRGATAREVRRMLDERNATPPDIVVGDLNIPRGSASIGMLFPGFAHAYDLAGHGYGASYPRALPLYHIDHVLISETSGLSIARYDTSDEGLSRHRAQKAWITAARD